jgi:hypothetical protein
MTSFGTWNTPPTPLASSFALQELFAELSGGKEEMPEAAFLATLKSLEEGRNSRATSWEDL